MMSSEQIQRRFMELVASANSLERSTYLDYPIAPPPACGLAGSRPAFAGRKVAVSFNAYWTRALALGCVVRRYLRRRAAYSTIRGATAEAKR